MKRRTLLGVQLLSGLLTLPARANDSAAELGAGGITLVRSDGIALLSEDLTISEDEVRVAYVFRNETAAPITTRVAFPVPDYDAEYEGDIALDRDSKNPMKFSVKVDGKQVKFQTESKKRAGMVKVTHHWTQTFPPGRELAVEHRYVPVAGAFFGPEGTGADPEMDKLLTKDYCVGPTLLASMKKQMLPLRTVHYILTSGANWKGPIRKFKLTLRKSRPQDKLSVCLPDTKKTSPTTFVVERSDFLPTEDLHILFVPARP